MNYICKIASLDELIDKADYEIERHPNNNIWVEFKNLRINNFKNNNSITYIGVLDDEIICEATAIINIDGFKGDIDNPDNLLSDDMVYLSGFRTNKEYENKGYFSKLFKYMENDLKSRGYKRLSLGVEPNEIRNILIYFHLGFINYIKTIVKDNNDVINFYYKDIK